MSLRLFAPRYWPTWLGLGLLRLLVLLPYPALLALGKGLGWLVRHLPVSYARIARRNLELCMPELSDTQREQLLARHFASLGIGLFETAMAWWSPTSRIQRLNQVEGVEHLHAAIANGKGALLLSAHFTTLEMSGRALLAYTPLNVMYRPTNNEVMSYFLARNRAQRLRRAIRRDDVRTLVTALKANEPVWYAPDQSYRNKGAQMVPFFGIACATNTATSRLAKMTGAAVLPYFPERLPDGRGYRMVILPPLENFPSDDAIADATRFHHLVEAHIRKVPEQYLWIHRRFKGLSEGYPDYYRREQR
ncbi:MAG: LpxL/LpxP family Kdo(2)-lipid IV(A) lauroyl/palmitoleoyl acyltransferase [Steroidobacteraceae bacterium]